MAFLLVSAPAARPGVSGVRQSRVVVEARVPTRRSAAPRAWRRPTSPQVSDQALSRGRGTSFVECTPPYVGRGRPLRRGSKRVGRSGPASWRCIRPRTRFSRRGG